ncbi:MAG: SIS domain-containing protein [Candidatus Devosia euplotis]|nr:SIS domain-containing protein [Candidatus Devosia euplotis]
MPSDIIDADAICQRYLDDVTALMRAVLTEECDPLDCAVNRLADQIAADRLVHVFGPAGAPTLPRRRSSSAPAG